MKANTALETLYLECLQQQYQGKQGHKVHNNSKADNEIGLDELTLVKKSGDLAERLCVSLM